MSHRVSWEYATSEDVAMDGVQPSWSPASAVWNTGRQLSGWLFPNPSLFSPSSHAVQAKYVDHDSFHVPSRSFHAPNDMDVDDYEDIKQSATKIHFNAIPVEILGEIFLHYARLPNDINSSTRHAYGRVSVSKRASTSPIALGHVCSYWRTLSLSMPILWSTISVIHPTPKDTQVLSTWIARSGWCPLRMTIIQKPSRGRGEPDRAINVILRLALEQRHRWQHISLQLAGDNESIFSGLEVGAYPSLETFHLDLKGWSQAGASMLCRSLYLSPNLRTIRFAKSWVRDPELLEAPWDQLTCIELNQVNWVDLVPLLSRASKLKKLVISALAGVSTGIVKDVILLPCLITLDLGLVDDVGLLFEYLTLPALSCLKLQSGFGVTAIASATWPILQTCLLASKCSLRSFSCANMANDEPVLLNMLSSPVMANLIDLSIESKVTDRLLAALTVDNETFILPRLQTLSLLSLHSTDISLSLALLIESRRRLSNILQSVRANVYSEVDSPRVDAVSISGVLLDVRYCF
ncbi:hypothetical protein FA15DRAFT_635975 [Coprinopsis marcescibilis]|uniref:Uncharacterized protein n=1 Tax=Coprinopsis marcescibilis TaxID=230819 RepID=A0A5C3L3M1_COPMA|nr:hypothetical protein FA15DRAFT_635975 [Coprinopsis marcescibilis]